MLRGAFGRVLDLLLPPRCLACGEVVASGDLCGPCWGGISFIGAPFCACCGRPFPFAPLAQGGSPDSDEASPLCAACRENRPVFGRARAVMRYDEASRNLILAFKHGDRTHGARAFGRWMRRAGAEMLDDADLTLPVPLHWTRLFNRRYNQSALLAHAVRAAGGPPVAADWLVRKRSTPPQGKLNGAARDANVKGAFALRPGRAADGLRLVLVDDVLTSGATVRECAGVLLRAGAARVDVLILARAGGEGRRPDRGVWRLNSEEP